jgi:heptosyltransferase-2
MTISILQAQPKNILIRSTNWIGDAIMTTPAVRTIRGNFPEATITMLAHGWMADVFASSPHVDEMFIYDKHGRHKGVLGMLRLARELRAKKFDCAFLLQNAFEAAFITFLAGIPIRAGYRRDGRAPLLHPGVAIKKEVRTLHQVHYYQWLLRDLGLTCGSNELCLSHSIADTQWATEFKQKLSGRKLVGINPGAAFGPAKCWPAKRYGLLAKTLHETHDVHCVVFGTKADLATIDEICSYGPAFITGLAGKTTLGQAMALIGQCDALVTNDSGLMHVGAATKTPLVAIFGSTDDIATGPYSDNAVVVKTEIPCQPCLQKECKGDFECMLNIGVAEVAAEMSRLLDTLESDLKE